MVAVQGKKKLSERLRLVLMIFYILVFSVFLCLFLQDHRAISKFIAYALCSTDEALRDAGWLPAESGKKERTVRNSIEICKDSAT